MGQSIQELPRVTDYQDTDLLLISREIGGSRKDRSIQRKDVFPRVRKAVLTLSSAEVLALNSTPKELVASPGAGKVLLPLRAMVRLTGVGTPYATNTTLVIQGGNETTTYWSGASIAASADQNNLVYAGPATGHHVDQDQPLQVTVLTGDPTAGDATITVTVWYLQEDI